MSDDFLKFLFAEAVAAADPVRALSGFLPPVPKGRTVVVGFGKAAARMAQGLENYWSGPFSGLVITPYGHSLPCRHIEVVEAAHPVPDAEGETAARRILALANELQEDDLLLCLVSGGGSALCAIPVSEITLAEKQSVNDALLKSGASISEINCVRKHLSAIKGGQLATTAYPASVVTLAISDVPGDDPSVIASGPTIADPTTFAEARAIVAHYAISVPANVRKYLEEAVTETPKPSDIRLERTTYQLIATPAISLQAAAQAARENGIEPIILGDAIEGDAEQVGAQQANKALAMLANAPCVLLSSGETTVKVRGSGQGGRNGQYLLALALTLQGHTMISAIACDTDGIDGTADNAGAIIRPDTLDRARALGLKAEMMLAQNDTYGFFSALGELVLTGPTHTNVNDFRAILIK